MNKVGRPKKIVTKRNRYSIRLTDDEIDMLDYLSVEKEKSKSEILLDALKLYYKIARLNE